MVGISQQRDYTWVILGVVGLVALGAVFLIAQPHAPLTFSNDLQGAATTRPGLDNFDTPNQVSGSLSIDEEATYKTRSGETYTMQLLSIASCAQVLVNKETYEICQGDIQPLNRKDSLYVRELTDETFSFSILNQWYAQSCSAVNDRQIAALGPNKVCCSGDIKDLPDCTKGDTPITCGERVIECSEGKLVSKHRTSYKQ